MNLDSCALLRPINTENPAQKWTMKVSIYKRASSNKVYLYLQIADKGNRVRESLKLHLFKSPKDQKQRNHNEATVKLADTIRAKKQLELQHYKHGEEYVANGDMTFHELLRQEVEQYRKKDRRKLMGMQIHFEAYNGSKVSCLVSIGWMGLKSIY